jgi:glucose/arabinose dehydrogenase
MKPAVIAAILLLVVGCNNTTQPEPGTEKPDKTPEEVTQPLKDAEVLATNLDVPWDMIKYGDMFYISLRGGEIIKVAPGGEVTPMALELQKDVNQQGEGGLLGFVLAPDFESTSEAFIYYTYKEKGETYNRIVKVKKVGNGWQEQDVLLSGIPGGAIHNGGRLEIGPDDKLYITTGDAGTEANAQDLNSLSGKILRMNFDGTVPADNPFPDSYVYSYGHRNPQGLAWSEDGKLYSAEHGSSAHDEINLIQPGKNYGWPVIMGDETKDGMVAPLFHSGEKTWAPSGLAYHEGKLYVAGLAGEQIRVFNLEKHTSEVFFENVGRIRDISIEDGSMYVITNNTDGRGDSASKDDRLLKQKLLQE